MRKLVRLTKHIPPGQFARYLTVGLTNTTFGYGTYALLTAVLEPGWSHGYLIAGLIANPLNITFAYLNYKVFVFKTKGNYLREWVRCLAVYSGGMLAGTALLPLFVFLIRRFTPLVHSAPYLAGACVTALAVISGFLGHKRFSFRQAPDHL